MSDPVSPYGPSPYQTPTAVSAEEVRLLPGGFVAPLPPVPLWRVLVFTAVATGITAAVLAIDPGLGVVWDLEIWRILVLLLMPLISFTVFVRICLQWYSSCPHVIAPAPGTQLGLTLVLPLLSFLIFAAAGLTCALAVAVVTQWQVEAVEWIGSGAGYFCAASALSLVVRLWYRPDFAALQ